MYYWLIFINRKTNMRTNELGELIAFVAVAEERSFRRAAARLNLTSSTLSHSLRSLEERLGVRLLNRTTRTVSPTAAGMALLDKIAPAFSTISEAVEDVNTFRQHPRGKLRINSPRIAYQMVFAPIFQRFWRDFPDITLEISLNDSFVDIVKEGFDAGIRLRSDIPQDMNAVRVTQDLTAAVYGSPDYFRRFPLPQTPQDLQQHLCIGRREISSGNLYRWEFAKDGKHVAIPVRGPLVLDTVDMMIDVSLQGIGLVYAADSEENRQHVAAGRLVRVLADWSPTVPGFYLYFPGHRQMSAAFKALIAAIRVDTEYELNNR
ncbi:LysR family transcriptional regulator [Enterobacteriaceae bacterium H20N1]|uniref:LysR family transcriptional regulator n=1 Tax=Dryocola boscaweniae TaxID=2925397 RepID=A0A9X2WAD2_9ENTR|nr:LysR family transcriptional regulator [Dryocola boscaweniae]MCT4703839.1 LysR family transcriptional regulator [Dryocola boscaweniae]MCT4717016.1 LysR family transcriptional regulator [Dryocola boscaweniae]MCT4721007.1 LysR family transcriptional regulator [Dryocola boscaweniae]